VTTVWPGEWKAWLAFALAPLALVALLALAVNLLTR